MIVQINRAWAPNGVDRFYQLVQSRFFDDQRFFRVVPGFVAQFGLSGDPTNNKRWDEKIVDDSVRTSNIRGTLSYASQGLNTRTHQLFFNLKDNPRLDAMGFAPIGRVVENVTVLETLYDGYGDRPDQEYIQARGNKYLDAQFPNLDRITSVTLLPPK
jgi:peptidyl-prolyl cis-trans isomerase A (cyclophilin A)